MSYLEQLKKQVAEQKAAELSRQQNEEKQEESFRVKVKPILQSLHKYFMELVKTLNYVKPDTSVNYFIEGYGTLDSLQQSNYRISGYTERGNECTFLFECVGLHKVRVMKHTELEMKVLKKELWKHGILFECSERLNDGYKFDSALFVIKPIVHVKFHFFANLESGNIDLTTRNFHQLGERFFTINPRQVNRKFLDEMAKYILRQPNTLKLDSKYKISTEQRTALRKETIKKDIEEFDEWLKSVDKSANKEESSKDKESKLKIGLFDRLRFFGKR